MIDVTTTGRKSTVIRELEQAHQEFLNRDGVNRHWKSIYPERLARKIAKQLRCRYEVSGPFGLTSRLTLYFYRRKNKSEDPDYFVIIAPISFGVGTFGYQTDEQVKNFFPAGTIGELNGLNFKLAEINSVKQVVEFIKTS